MAASFPKKYDPQFERAMYDEREKAGYFSPDATASTTNRQKKQFVVPLPPPNVTGVLHLGHAIMLAIQDTMVRYHRMQGFETVWIPGTDHAGIATQVVVERQLAADNLTKDDLGRPAFLNKVWEWVHYSRNTILSQIRYMGASVDWSREQFTLSETLSRSVRKAFKQLFDEGKIYQDTYMVNRSPGAKTVLSDLEVEYKEQEGKMYYIRYFVQGKGDSITVATVRPETIFADVAIAVHPKDRRYKKRIGKNVLIPIVNRPIPVIADEDVAVDFGTGALKITPTHAEADFAIAMRHQLPLDRFAFDKDNIFTDRAGEELAGKEVYDFMDNLIQLLEEIGNLADIEEHTSSIPYCERTGERVQPRLSKQWFMDVKQAAEKVGTNLETDAVEIHPERFTKTFHQRLDEIRPWCISRQLRWGHRIPVWTDTKGNQYVRDDSNVIDTHTGEYTILSRMIFNLIADSRLPNPFNIEQLIQLLASDSLLDHEGNLYSVYRDIYATTYGAKGKGKKELSLLDALFHDMTSTSAKDLVKKGGKLVDILDASANISKKGDTYHFVYMVNGEETSMQQEEDVLDTWFSSALRPFSIVGRPEATSDLEQFYPATVLETGYDIIFFWVIRMMLMGIALTDQMPFSHVYLHGLVRDQYGKKMSKSKNNVIDPMKMIQTYGADALRGALLLGNTPGTDQKFVEQKVDYTKRFINKVRNASRFVLMSIDPAVIKETSSYDALAKHIREHHEELNDYDRWMLGKMYESINQIEKYQEKFMLGESLQTAIDLVWHDFCDRYIEIAKLQSSPLTDHVLLYVLGTFYKVLHPSLPFVTEKLRGLLGFDGSISISAWSSGIDVGKKNYRINLLMEMISQWRNLKQQVCEKPHESVDLFVQANKDIQLLVEEHFDLVRDILRVGDMQYINEHEDTDEAYSIAMIMDIKVGAKGVVERDWKQVLQDLEKQVADEQQFLQRLRGTLANTAFVNKAPDDVIAAKKQKMEEVKTKIAQLELEINKIKMEHK